MINAIIVKRLIIIAFPVNQARIAFLILRNLSLAPALCILMNSQVI